MIYHHIFNDMYMSMVLMYNSICIYIYINKKITIIIIIKNNIYMRG